MEADHIYVILSLKLNMNNDKIILGRINKRQALKGIHPLQHVKGTSFCFFPSFSGKLETVARNKTDMKTIKCPHTSRSTKSPSGD